MGCYGTPYRDESFHGATDFLFFAEDINIFAGTGLPRWAGAFPYVNGGLFSGSVAVPRLSRVARSYLLHIGGLDWRKINPDIFGSMIQVVADEDERGSLGMHYTSVPNILKVLRALVLEEERAVEAEINRRRGEAGRASVVPLTNFRGIELRDFPAEVARLALIIAEYQCDVWYRGERLALADYGSCTGAVAAFVVTNNVCQGQQVPVLWPLVFATGHEIVFAHTSFKWANLASHNAGVTVVVVGISRDAGSVRRLFSLDDAGVSVVKEVERINAYLVPDENLVVAPMSRVTDERGLMEWGNKPTDGGNLLLTADDRLALLRNTPEAVRQMRLASRDVGARKMAARSHQFREMNHGETHAIVVPMVSSENRDFLPVGLVDGETIVGDRNFALYDAPLWNMALIASRLHWVWIGAVCAQLEMRFSYSNTLGWNTFPVPLLTEKNKADLTRCAEDILVVRERYFPATITELYDPGAMPEELRATHLHNDEVVERIFIGRRFRNDTERLEKLFQLYTKMTAPAASAAPVVGAPGRAGASV